MLKSVPICFCSIAFIVVLPPTANPGQSYLVATTKNVSSIPAAKSVEVTIVKDGPSSVKKTKMAMSVPNEQGMKFVHRYIRNNDDCLSTVKQRSEGPFSIIDSVFTQYHLPLELKYLAVIESELKPTALSRVGAKGPWQLMPATGRVLGLKVNRHRDDRSNYYKSTRAAAKYLRDLHREFGDWLLVLAAYNGGPKPVYRAIRKSHSRNFWALQKYLPAESRLHVKKFIATAYYFEGADTVAAPSQPQAAIAQVAVASKPKNIQESPDEKFTRLMKESAKSLKAANETLDPVVSPSSL